jgi:hypothetical protein
MFAAAKTEVGFGLKVHIKILCRVHKNNSNFLFKKYCQSGKRVLYLHPLKVESFGLRNKKVHRHIELTA